MDFLELGAHQSAFAEFGQGADQFGPPDFEGQAVIRPDLGDVIERGNQSPGGLLLDQGEITRAEGGMRLLDQVARPLSDALVGAVIAVNQGVEIE